MGKINFMFSILIPTFNNLKYLELCINSIKKNSSFNHQIIAHVNIGDDGTVKYLDENYIEYTHTNYNSGICEGINKASNLAKFKYSKVPSSPILTWTTI